MIPLVSIVSVLGMMCYAFYRSDKNLWNKGSCPCEKGFWKHFDNDSQGGRGYQCAVCGKFIWISYNVDKG